ncbi:MAG TPA: HAMP domain-containing sensor histidine kinase [Cyclobacteriaceae bacterium]|nr:HAMP domain-containing histidine kinase [Cyclobacteriaceae bacterium]HMV08046.1 HAMP domain-containing sensor histidine kinase [Cyclobacteriaceae bacterium]HMV88262.1 HAMP domain-containing sensor histidine kinase [Cyclobacteriaceae bacterium]HMX00686.1 HAMP domain-containing sensor histidine kinase [Cyclobacteriaceae bacterium]HMX49439.1 HAMP domain-containing sensor histidine kinase [Cyclobacteriaceae bacterium]
MKTSTIRFIVVLATLSIVGISITQVYWVKRAFDLKEDEFKRNVNTALLNVAQQIYSFADHGPAPTHNPVKQLSTNYFVVMVNSQIDASLLEFMLRTEFDKRKIQADFEYGIYDCANEKMMYGNYVQVNDGKSKTEISKNLPKWNTQGYYFGVQFPNREAQIINQMGIWSFSSVVLLVVIVFFAYTLFVILKQKRLSEIQKDFINNMTHEFKTPIATIALSTEVLKSPDILRQPERLLSYTTIIENENKRLKQHVERVLQMAKLDKESIELKKEAVNLHEVVQEVTNGMATSIQEKKIEVDLDLQAVEPVIQADKLHATNVVYNLLDNAIKYSAENPKIWISVKQAEKHLVLEVKDNGIGVKEDDQKKIFDKFFRVPTGNVHNVKGFGLGLNYVRQIVDAHRGKITVKSHLGEGCTFRIYFPR